MKVIRASQLEDQQTRARNEQVRIIPVPECLNADRPPKRLQREMDIWIRLNHANVLPFYGTCADVVPGRVALVSPWMENDSLPSYISRFPTASKSSLVSSISHTKLSGLCPTLKAEDIMSGLKYLHNYNVIHGDIKGVSRIHRRLSISLTLHVSFRRTTCWSQAMDGLFLRTLEDPSS